MRFWTLRRSRAASLAELPAKEEAADTRELQPIRVFTVSGECTGALASRGLRVTDLLNAQPELLIHLDGPGTRGQWLTIHRDAILIVAPPPFVSQRRIHRQRRSVHVTIGDWVVTGVAHSSPMGGLDPTKLRPRHRFLPMTNVRIARADGSEDGEEFAVAIVNVSNVKELREVSLA